MIFERKAAWVQYNDFFEKLSSTLFLSFKY